MIGTVSFRKLFLAGVSALAAAFVGASASATTITGETVRVDWIIHQSGFSPSTFGTATTVVGPGLELPNFSGLLDIDLGANTITLTKATSNVGFGGAPSFDFNGFVFTDINGTISDFTSFSILSQTAVAGSGLSAANLSFDANELRIDLGATSWNSLNGSTATFSFATVPEPGVIVLFAVGIGGLACARRRRRK
ncbi:MAG: PEP-CTERM sorting domain-containing protein [Alphaproteobacteria bacterium]